MIASAGEPMSRLGDFGRALRNLGVPYRQRSKRWPGTGLAAHYALHSAARPAAIKDISASGICLLMQEPLPTGEMISLVLRKQGAPKDGSDLELFLRARVTRLSRNSVGLALVLPPGTNANVFEVLLRNVVSASDPEQGAEMFRTIRTVLFLYRICGAEAGEPMLLLDGQLDSGRAANLFKIAIAAENLLASEPDADRMRAHPKMVASVLRQGSWAPDQLTLQLWTGLLVSFCSVDAPDDSNQVLVDLLVNITPTQARIFTRACERPLNLAAEAQDATPGHVVLSLQEMIQLTGVHELGRNATDIAYLYNLGLIEKVFDFTTYRDTDSFDITPARLGLELYKHCHGLRGKLDPRLVESAREHLAVFLPPPIPLAYSTGSPESYLSFTADC
jgi:hypothetical protein